MQQPIYFSKVEFRECAEKRENIILLNLAERELSYQEFARVWQMPAIQEGKSILVGERVYNMDSGRPGRVIRNEKTGFESQLLPGEYIEYRLLHSCGVSLSEAQVEALLPYCNALEFEDYRDKKASKEDAGITGYADEVNVYFRAVTDAHLPLIELSMEYYHDNEYAWPHERLYKYLRKNLLQSFADVVCEEVSKRTMGLVKNGS